MKKYIKMKKAAMLSLVAMSTASLSGVATYFMMSTTKSSKNEDIGNIVLPDIDDHGSTKKEAPLSKALNSLLNSQEIYDSTVSLSLKPNSGETVNLNLNNLNVDLSNLNRSIVNLKSDLQVQYGKSEEGMKRLDQTLSLRIENNEACYVSYKNRNFLFNVPQNLSDLMEVIKATGLLVNNSAEATSGLDLSSLLDKLKSVFTEISSTDPVSHSGDESLLDMDISIPDVVIGNTKISNLSLRLTADKSTYALKGIKSLSDGICISTRKASDQPFESGLYITLDGSLQLRDASNYVTLSQDDIKNGNYASVTDANTSVFNTISDIVGNDLDVGIEVAVDRTISSSSGEDTNTSSFKVDGLLQCDVMNQKYALNLNHLSQDSTNLNSLSLKYLSGNVYFQLNDLLKAKLSNQNVSDIFSDISKITNSSLIEIFASQINQTLSTLNIDNLKNGDMTQIQELLDSTDTYFDYDATSHSFLLSIDGIYLGLTSTPIKLQVTCSDDSVSRKSIQKITISGLTFSSTDSSTGKKELTTASVTFTPQSATEIEAVVEGDYQDLKGTVSIFSALADMIDRRKFYAEYSLTYKDKINDGTNNNYSTIAASGKLGADLTKLTKKDSVLDSFSLGTYFLGMSAQCGSTTHNLNMNYQDVDGNHNLYFGYDTIYQKDSNSTTNTVFRNYLENASLGEMNTILNEKTDSDISSVFEDSSRILDFLCASQEFQDMISKVRKGSLQGLEKFVSLTSGTITEDGKEISVLQLKINVNQMFDSQSYLGKHLGNILINLRSDDMSFKGIEISTCLSDSQEFSFHLDFKDYEDVSLSGDEITTYQKLDDFSSLTKSFYNISTNIKKYGIKVEALYKKDPVLSSDGTVTDYGTALSMSGSAYWDLTDSSSPQVSGSLNIEHPYVSIDSTLSTKKTKATQNLKFKYQNTVLETEATEGQFTVDYNDNMHVALHSSTIKDMVDTISSTSEANLLNSLLSNASDITTSMPLVNVIKESAPSLLLDYPYIKKVSLNSESHTLSLSIDKRLFNVSSEGDSVVVKIKYEDGDEPTIDSISVDLSKDGKTVAQATLSLVAYDESQLPSLLEYNDANKGKFVSLDGLSTLTKMMIDTTENNYFHFTGYLNLDFTMFNSDGQVPINLDALCFDLNFDVSLYIDDNGQVNTYFSLCVGDKDISQAGYYVTEYAFASKDIGESSSDYVYINNTRTDAVLNEDESISNQISYKAYRVSKGEFTDNILYYLVSLGLDMDDRIAGRTIMANIYHTLKKQTTTIQEENSDSLVKTEDASSLTSDIEISLDSDFSKLFAVYDENHSVSSALYDQAGQKFSLNLNVNDVFSLKVGKTSLFSFDDVSLKLYHMTKTSSGETTTPFYAAQFSSQVDILSGLGKVSLTGGIQVVHNGNDVDMAYINSDEEGKSTLQNKMSRYYSLISQIDGAVNGDYSISPTVLSKTIYDFNSMKLSTFINDYELNENSNFCSGKVMVTDFLEKGYPLVFVYQK
jgi:hypothetical protein